MIGWIEQHEFVVVDGIPDQRQPVAGLLVLGLVLRGRVDHVDAVATFGLGRAQRVARLRQHGLRACIFLADQHAADADVIADRLLADFENVLFERLAQDFAELTQIFAVATAGHDAEGVLAQTYGDIGFVQMPTHQTRPCRPAAGRHCRGRRCRAGA